ncbi:MAG TPA: substrate-binding domain-containing protein [Puia sp.]|jgi:LacI family transcriptional regulator
MPYRTNTIGVIVHKLDSYFITSALKGIEKVAAAYGYELIITHSQESMDIEVANAQLLFDRRVDGVIASLSLETKDTGHFSAFTGCGIPVVFFDRVDKTAGSDMVVIDNAHCGFMATEHLIKQGCRRIAIITPNPTRSVYAQRYKGFREALKDYTIPFSEELLILEDCDKEGGMDAAWRVMHLDPMPDGLFITNDLVAAVCMHTLKEEGISVPEDIAIVGFNNDPVGRLITPTLTTIDYPGVEIGKTAAMSLLSHLTGGLPSLESHLAVVPSGLIVRGSSLRGNAALRRI